MPYPPADPNGLVPPPEFIGISAPKNTVRRNRKTLVYGFPLPSEYIDYQYHYKCERESLKGNDFRGMPYSRTKFLGVINDSLVSLCRKIYPEGAARIKMGLVKTSGYGGGSAMFIVVGQPGRKPPREVIEKLTDALEEYGLIELPDWYPAVPF